MTGPRTGALADCEANNQPKVAVPFTVVRFIPPGEHKGGFPDRAARSEHGGASRTATEATRRLHGAT